MERPELQKICRQCERDPVIMRTRTHTAEGQPCPSDVPNTPLLSPHKHSLFHSCCIKVQFGVLRELCTHEAITAASVMTTSARVERACAPAVLPLRPCPPSAGSHACVSVATRFIASTSPESRGECPPQSGFLCSA